MLVIGAAATLAVSVEPRGPRSGGWPTLLAGALLTALNAAYLYVVLRRAELLRASESRFRMLVEQAPDAIFVYDVDAHRFVDANRSAERLFASSKTALLASGPPVFVSTSSTPVGAGDETIADLVRRALGGEDIVVERTVQDAAGAQRVCEVRVAPLPSAGHRMLRVSFNDITERKRSEETLLLANSLLTSEIESAPDGVLVVEAVPARASCNRKFVAMWGISEATVAGADPLEILDEVLAMVTDPDAFRAAVARFREHPDEPIHRELELRDGRVFEWHTGTIERAPGDSLGRISFFRDITQRKEGERELQFANTLLTTAMETSPDAILVVDDAGRIASFNQRFVELWRIPSAMVEAGNDAPVLAAVAEQVRDREEFLTRIRYLYNHPGEQAYDEILTADARVIERHSAGLTAPSGESLGRIWFFRDVSESRHAALSLRASEQRFRAVSETALDAIIMVDAESRVHFWNRAAERILGYSAVEASNQRINEWLGLRGLNPHGTRDAAPAFSGDGLDAGRTLELVATRKDGVEIPIELAVNPMTLGLERYAVGILRDITDRKRSEAQIARLARYDHLTGLANRTVFVEALQHAIARAHRGGPKFAVLYLDLDHFKDVNDTLGHPIGDLLLQWVAARIQSGVRQTDTVARFGGDEFALIAADIRNPEDAAVLADKLLRSLAEPLTIEGNEIRSGTSAGIAVFGADSPDAETLLSHADVALYRAKAEGRGAYRFFTDAMDAEVRTRVVVAAELRTAIATAQLFLMYQPQVDLATGRIVGLEALVRWHHPTRGVVRPAFFIQIAERSGLIVPLGRWVMRQACEQTKEWLNAGIALPLIAVNLSALQFKTPLELEKTISTILEETGLSPNQLELELTESALMEASREHNDVLVRLREKGLRIAIDDFGTGYSSLDYLRRFRVDRIKIAQSFIADLGVASGSAPIVRAALGLARELGIEVVVEGVETAVQLELLKAWGSRVVQGYHFSKPLAAADATALLKIGRITPSADYSPIGAGN